jgi:hypothetical protein
MRRLIGLVLLLVAVCSCESDGAEAERACADYADQACRLGQTCSPQRFDEAWGDAASCREGQILDCKRHLSAPGSNETPTGISSCARALASLSCGENWPAVCDTPAGQLANETPCISSSQCRGRQCMKAAGQESCGVCRTLETEGGACAFGVGCLPPLICEADKCMTVPPREEGETCDRGTFVCRYPLVCFAAADGGGAAGTCAPRLSLGATCVLSPVIVETCDTEKGLLCDPLTETCRPFTPLPALGEACAEGSCNGSGRCNGSQCVPRAREGQSCETQQCLLPAVCVNDFDKMRKECRMTQPDQCK